MMLDRGGIGMRIALPVLSQIAIMDSLMTDHGGWRSAM